MMNRLFRLRDRDSYAKIQELIEGEEKTTANNSQDNADTIDIIKPNGSAIATILSHVSPNLCLNYEKIRKQVIDNFRKLPEAYEHDVIQMVIDNSYIYYKFYREVLIIVIAVSFYSTQGAEQTMRKITIAYDETLLQNFGQYTLPKHIGYPEQRKIQKISGKVLQILEQEKREGISKGQQISRTAENSEFQVEQLGRKSTAFDNLRIIETKQQKVLKRSLSLAEKSKKISIIKKIKKYVLFLLIMVNLVMLVYCFWDRF